jgi:hypothetical protein
MSARGGWLVAALLAVSALGVGRTQPRLAKTAYEVKERDDVYALPPPTQLHLFALGYDAAAVDLLWAKLLVEFGTHWHEKRDFHPDHFIDAILELEPTYAPVYRFGDTLLCYHPMHATEADARKTRELLQRGTRERPGDYMVWTEYGQFTAFLGPGFLASADAAEKDRWRRDGALALTRAVELGADTGTALIAATILGRSGERQAAIESLRRTYMIEDDPDKREEILAKMGRLQASAQSEETERRARIVESMWRKEWPFLTRDEYLLLAPVPDAARCAGLDSASDPACATDWETVVRSQSGR